MNATLIWGKDRDEGITMPPPELRYAEPVDQGRRDARETRHHAWERVDEVHWRWSDSLCCLDARLKPFTVSGAAPASILSVTVTALAAVHFGRCAVVLESPGVARAHYVDRFLQWRPVRGATHLNDIGALVVRWSALGKTTAELRLVRGMTSVRLRRNRDRLRLEIDLDTAALHPRWQFSPAGKISTAAPAWGEGQTSSLEFLLASFGGDPAPPAFAGRFPRGAEAAFVLTDHCDFDDPGRLRLFLNGDGRDNGWLGRGLRLTKGVFMLRSVPENRPAVPTLEDDAYRTLIEALHKDGSEIVPHALTETGTVAAPVFREAVTKFSAHWAPATWVDHGKTIAYCYTMGGARDADYDLLGTLRKNGFRSLWSYHDIPIHGTATLNLLAPTFSDFPAMVRFMVRHLFGGEFLIAMHYIRSSLERHLRGRVGRLVMQSLSTMRGLVMNWSDHRRISRSDLAHAWRRMRESLLQSLDRSQTGGPEPFNRRELLEGGAVLYPERAVPLNQCRDDDLLLFATMEAVHCRDMYTPAAIDRLINERGLHLGHCYLMNDLRYIAGLFEHGAESPRLTVQWTGLVNHVADLVGSHRLWNPTMGELATWLGGLQLVSIIPFGPCEIQIDNSSSRALLGFTLLVPLSASPDGLQWSGGPPGGWRRWQDWLAVWGDLPAGSRTVVRWSDSTP